MSGDNWIRVRAALDSLFINKCPRAAGLGPTDPSSVGDHLEAAMELTGLNRSLPKWGLQEIPHLDFDVHTFDDINRMIEETEVDWLHKPQNDFLNLAFTHYMRKYDIKTVEDEITAWNFKRLLSFGPEEEEADLPIAVTLDRFAAERGLRLKN